MHLSIILISSEDGPMQDLQLSHSSAVKKMKEGTRIMMRRLSLLPLASLALGFSSLLQAQEAPIKITADLTEATRKLFHAEIDIPVRPGPVSLTTVKWIPANHSPTGSVGDITGVVFTANGKVLTWHRDDKDLYEFHVTIPDGVTSLHAHLDCIVTDRVSQKIAILEWEKLMLYPADTPVKDIRIQPNVNVPEGWGIGTSLTPTDGYDPQHPKGGLTHFATTTVEQLEDSPIMTGEYFHEFALAPEVTPKHYIDVISDFPEDSELRPVLLAELSNLVRESLAAYNSHHYYAYHFLLALSDVIPREGREHGESSANIESEKGFSDEAHQLSVAELLPHEFTHSWNGKYQRPYNLYQDNFAKMEEGSLLWVYEGMTRYLADVLAARSGLMTQDQYRDMLAATAATLDNTPGREWRSTEDTAVACSVLRALLNSNTWANWRRSRDYYQEGELFWLDADTLIQQKSNGQKSLTDFLHIFLGKGGNTGPLIITFNRDEIIADLNQVLKYDWASFIHERIDEINPRADFAGITQGGYKLVYTDKPTKTQRTLVAAAGRHSNDIDVWYSIGIRVNSEGVIADVRWEGPADKAKLFPGQKIIGVNGIVFSGEALKAAIKKAKGAADPIRLILQNDKFITLSDLDYHDGERYPTLVRMEGTPDYLDDITKPVTKIELPSAH
jgi:predicted metalloprotease with PDZ domain